MGPHSSIALLGRIITPETVRGVIQKASAVPWGTHLLRWRYFDVQHEDVVYHRGALVTTSLWHLLKRVYVDRDWPVGTRLEDLNEAARDVIRHSGAEIYVYGYYRTDPPRLQWGFLQSETGIAVIYDMEAELIATVFKPEEGRLFFDRQRDVVQINRKAWKV